MINKINTNKILAGNNNKITNSYPCLYKEKTELFIIYLLLHLHSYKYK